MSDVNETLEMARESYAVAYVTGEHITLLTRDEYTYLATTVAVCATTMLFDYCLTFGDEVCSQVRSSMAILHEANGLL